MMQNRLPGFAPHKERRQLMPDTADEEWRTIPLSEMTPADLAYVWTSPTRTLASIAEAVGRVEEVEGV